MLTSMSSEKNISSAQPKKCHVCGLVLSAVHQVRGLRTQTVEKHRKKVIVFGVLKGELSTDWGLRVTNATEKTGLLIVQLL